MVDASPSCMVHPPTNRELFSTFAYDEAFGTAGNGSRSPARRFLTNPARNSANGTIFSPTLAFSRAFTKALRSLTGMTVHGYPPAAIIVFIRNRPTLPLPSILRMDVDKYEMRKHHADGRMRLCRQQIADRRTPA
jgi:hypothetical protein